MIGEKNRSMRSDTLLNELIDLRIDRIKARYYRDEKKREIG